MYDPQHKQLFILKDVLNRVDVYSTSGYIQVGSISVGSPLSLDISLDGSTLAVTNGTSFVSLYDTQSFKLIRRVLCVSGSNGVENSSGITNFLFTSDGKAVIQIGDSESSVDLATGALETIATFGTNTRMTRSGDGSKVVIGSLHVYDVATRQLTMESSVPNSTVTHMVANRDGSKFAMCADNGGTTHVVLLDQNLNVLADTPGRCNDLVFSGDNTQLYTSFEQLYAYSGIGVYDASNLLFLRNATAFGQHGEYSILEADETGLIFRVWDSSLFVIDTTVAGSDGTDLYWPYSGLSPTSTSLHLSPAVFLGGNFGATAAVNFDDKPAPIIEVVSNLGSMNGLLVAAPVSETKKVASVYVQQQGFRVGYPSSFAYGTQLVRMLSTVGSTQGGEFVELEAIGIGTDPNLVQVTFGGAPATTFEIQSYASLIPPVGAPLERVIVKTPPGAPGWVDVTINSPNGSATLQHAFQYANQSATISIQGALNYILYDAFRDRVYVSNQDQVEVIDPNARVLLAPLLPPGGKLNGSSFAGLAMSPDGSRMYVADRGTNKVLAIDPDHPAVGEAIDLALLIGTSASPIQVAATSTRKLLVLMSSSLTENMVYEYDLDAGTIRPAANVEGTLTGNISSSRDGSLVVATETLKYGGEPVLALLNYTSGTWRSVRQLYIGTSGVLSADGNIAVVGQTTNLLDSSLHLARHISGSFTQFDHFATVSSAITNPSGSLLFVPYTENYDGVTTTGIVRVFDVNREQVLGSVVFPEGFPSTIDYLSKRYFALDDTGHRLFGITSSGVSIVELYEPPLTIGHVEPPFGPPAGGGTVTIRGTDFKPGATITFGSSPAVTTIINENTLTAVVPALPLGDYDVTVANPDNSYTAPGMYTVTAARTTPVLTSLDPPSAFVLGPTLTVTVHGQNFYPDSVVRYNNREHFTRFIDGSTIQTELNTSDLLQTGPVPVSVFSPLGGGTSGSLPFTVVNAIPSISKIYPSEILTGTPGTTLGIIATGLCPDSVVQWNGVGLITTFNANYPQQITAAVPPSFLASDTTVQVTIFNPAPGGGVSNASTVNVGPPTPVLSFPASIDFGTVVVGGQTGNPYTLANIGTADLHISSIIATPSDFKANGCATVLAPGTVCTFNAGFVPSSPGEQTGTITITDDGRGNPHIIQISGSGIVPPLPEVVLSAPTNITPSSAALNASVNTHNVVGEIWAQWGTTNALGNNTSTWSIPKYDGIQQAHVPLSGLSGSTTYYYRILVTTVAGTSSTPLATFTTDAVPVTFDLGIASGTSTTASINAGDSASYSLTVTGLNGYAGTATLSCSGAPQYATCSAPSSINFGYQAAPFTVWVRTTKPSTAAPSSVFLARWRKFGLTIPAFLFVFQFAKRRSRRLLLLALALLLGASLSSCGGGGGGTVTPPPSPGTPSGTYSLVVSAVSGNVTKTINLTLAVK